MLTYPTDRSNRCSHWNLDRYAEILVEGSATVIWIKGMSLLTNPSFSICIAMEMVIDYEFRTGSQNNNSHKRTFNGRWRSRKDLSFSKTLRHATSRFWRKRAQLGWSSHSLTSVTHGPRRSCGGIRQSVLLWHHNIQSYFRLDKSPHHQCVRFQVPFTSQPPITLQLGSNMS
jgi:hypothetical protein